MKTLDKKSPLFAEMIEQRDLGRIPIMIYPRIDEETIAQAIDHHIDRKKYKKEISKVEKIDIPGHDGYQVVTLDGDFPEMLNVIGIMRECAFRNNGMGVGHVDVDSYDMLPSMKQLVVIKKEHYNDPMKVIIGGYRYQIHQQKDDYQTGPCAKYFHITSDMTDATWIELGRSFMNPSHIGRATFDMVLMALGMLAQKNEIAGYFGKVTIPFFFDHLDGRGPLIGTCKAFMKSGLMVAKESHKINETDPILSLDMGLGRIAKAMHKHFRSNYSGLNVMSILMTYDRLAPLREMYYCGTVDTPDFGCSSEFGFAIRRGSIYPHIVDKCINVWT